MKKTLIATVVFASLATQGFAFDFISNNITAADATALPIVDNAGNAIAVGTGFVAIGTFASGSPDFTTLADDFTIVGAVASTSFSNTNNFSGFFQLSQTLSIPEGTTGDPVGQQAYVVIGNESTLAASTQFAVLTTGEIIGTEDQFGNGEITQSFTSNNVSSALVIGNQLENFELAGLGTFNNAVQLVGVPEPSSALLSLVGLAFIARRRR